MHLKNLIFKAPLSNCWIKDAQTKGHKCDTVVNNTSRETLPVMRSRKEVSYE